MVCLCVATLLLTFIVCWIYDFKKQRSFCLYSVFSSNGQDLREFSRYLLHDLYGVCKPVFMVQLMAALSGPDFMTNTYLNGFKGQLLKDMKIDFLNVILKYPIAFRPPAQTHETFFLQFI